jgi:hypothetical protein
VAAIAGAGLGASTAPVAQPAGGPWQGAGPDVVFVLTSSVEDPKEQQDYIRDMTNYIRSALPS